MFIWLVIAALLESPPQVLLVESEGFMEFSHGHSLSLDRRIVASGIIQARTGGWDYWFRLRHQVDDSSTIMWTDTIRCPQARALLENAASLDTPQIDIPGISNFPMYVTADGDWYEIRVSANSEFHGSELSFSSGNRSELAQWVDESLETLEECWSDELPEAHRSQ